MLSRKEIEHIAKLARIKLTEKEEEKLQVDLSRIFDFVRALEEVDISDTKPTFYPIPLQNIMREDKAQKERSQIAAKLRNLMPETKNGFLKVKSIFENL